MSPRSNCSLDSSISTGDSSQNSCTWPSPSTSSSRKDRFGNGPKTNGMSLKYSNDSSPRPPSSYNLSYLTRMCSSDWRWTLPAMPQEQFYASYERMTNGTQEESHPR